MVPSMQTPASNKRSRMRLVIAAVLAVVVLWDTSAYAINALVSQDIPLLTQIAAQEVANHTELVAIVSQATATVSQIKEMATFAKTVYGAFEELVTLSPKKIAGLALQRGKNAFPEIDQIYSDVKDIADLDYRDQRGYLMVRGLLWDEIYGPAFDYFHDANDKLDAMAIVAEAAPRAIGKAHVARSMGRSWADDCDRTSADGKLGPCKLAADKATILQVTQLADLTETAAQIAMLEQRQVEQNERDRVEAYYQNTRIAHDLRAFVEASVFRKDCLGSCVYESYGDKLFRRINEARARVQREKNEILESVNDSEEAGLCALHSMPASS